MPDTWITFTCANPACGRTVTKRWRPTSEPKPQYCELPCWFAVRRRRPFMWRKYVFTPAMDQQIRVACRKVGALKRLWQTGVFGDIPYPIVKRQARKLGVVRRQPDQNWTPEEEALLAPYIERQAALETMAKSLKAAGYHRTPSAIREHLHVLGWSTRQGTWTLYDIAQGLEIDDHVVAKWVQQGKLKVHRTSDQPHARSYVTDAALCRFLVQYPYDAAHGDLRIPWIITLVAGTTAERRSPH